MHLFAIGLGDSLGNNAFIKAANQLFNTFTISSFYTHRFARLDERKTVAITIATRQ